MTFDDLKWLPHYLLPGHIQARANGCSVISGPLIDGYEIMTPDGEVHANLTPEEITETLKEYDDARRVV